MLLCSACNSNLSWPNCYPDSVAEEREAAGHLLKGAVLVGGKQMPQINSVSTPLFFSCVAKLLSFRLAEKESREGGHG